MATAAQICSSLCYYTSIRDSCVLNPSKIASTARFARKLGRKFASGSPLLIQRPFYLGNTVYNSKSVSIRCEQSTKEGNGLDIWHGRTAMVGFAAAISVEIATGKGLLENFGLPTPLPTVALAVTALVRVLTAVFIFQSLSELIKDEKPMHS